MNIKDFILGYLIGKQDGGGGASVEPLTVTENGEYSEEGVAYSPVTVNVPSGASNFKTGTFKGDVGESNIIVDVDTGYTGNGYPIAVFICVDGGAYNPAITEWYDSAKAGNIGITCLTKNVFTSTPAYSDGANDKVCLFYIYKYSGGYTRGGYMDIARYTQTDPSNSLSTALSIKDKKTIRCYVNQGADYGFAAGVTYRYWVVYSE